MRVCRLSLPFLRRRPPLRSPRLGLLALACLCVSLSARAQTTARVTGKITLPSAVNSAQIITFTFCATGGSASLTRLVTLDASGNYTLANIPRAQYTLGIKGAKWLRTNILVDVTPGDVSNANATLRPGDINADNVVNSADQTLLTAALGSSPGSANWNPNADLNCDNTVNSADQSLLTANLNLTGDPAPNCSQPLALPIPDWGQMATPTDESGGGDFGPSSADSVNLATGGYSNRPDPDLVVHNPIGPDVVYARSYHSVLARQSPPYSSQGLSAGWVDNYDSKVRAPAGSWGPLTLVYPDGAQEQWTVPAFTGTNPVPFGTIPGAPYQVMGYPSATNFVWSQFVVTFADRTTWTFTPGLSNTFVLTRIADLLSHALILKRDAAHDRLTSIANLDGDLLFFDYLPSALLDRIRDVYGRQVKYDFTSSAGATRLTGVSTISSIGDAYVPRWQYAYTLVTANRWPFLTSVGVKDPKMMDPGDTTILSRPIQYDPTTGLVQYLEDANHNRRSYTYAAGTQVTVTDSAGNLVQTWNQSLLTPQRDAGSTNAYGNTTTLLYGEPNAPYSPLNVYNREGKLTQFAYEAVPNENKANLKSVTDPRGLQTVYTYDYNISPLGWLTGVQEIGEGGTQKTPTTFTYNANNRLLHTVTSALPGTSGGATVTTEYSYDSYGSISIIRVPHPNDQPGTVAYVYAYTSDPDYDINGNPGRTSLSLPLGIGRPLYLSDPLGHLTHYRYDARGNLTILIDALGNRTDYAYNLADQLVRVTYAPTNPATPTARAHTDTLYQYAGGPVISVSLYAENGTLWRKVLAQKGNEAELRQASGSVPSVSFTPDAQYRPTRQTDGKSQTTTNAFDAVGNLWQVRLPYFNSATNFDGLYATYSHDHMTSFKNGRAQTVKRRVKLSHFTP